MLDLILTVIIVLVLFVSSVIDLKTREVPDELSIGLVITAVVLKFLHAYEINNYSILISSLIGFLIFLGVSMIAYYTRQWGGGDAKLFIALGIAMPYYPSELSIFNPNLNVDFMLILVFNILLSGFVYGIGYLVYLMIRNKNKLKKLNLRVNIFYFLLPLAIMILSLFFSDEPRILLLMLAFLVLIYPYLTRIVKFAEMEIMTYPLRVDKLTEGDWVVEDVYHKNDKVYSRKSPGVTKEQIELFKKYRIKNVMVREGIPFVPAIFLGVLLSLIFGSIFSF